MKIVLKEMHLVRPHFHYQLQYHLNKEKRKNYSEEGENCNEKTLLTSLYLIKIKILLLN